MYNHFALNFKSVQKFLKPNWIKSCKSILRPFPCEIDLLKDTLGFLGWFAAPTDTETDRLRGFVAELTGAKRTLSNLNNWCFSDL